MLEITVANSRQQHTFKHETGSVVFGRAPKGDGRHFVVTDPHVSRVQTAIEAIGDGLRVTNFGLPISVDGHGDVETNTTVVVELPAVVTLGMTRIEVRAGAEAPTQPTTGSEQLRTIHWSTDTATLEPAPTAERLAEWFQTLLSVQRAAAGSAQFYDETVRAIVDLIGLDRGFVLLREGDVWRTAATYPASVDDDAYSRTVLAELFRTRQTVFHQPGAGAASLQAIDAFVASPILDASGDVIGALFGARDRRPGLQLPGIEALEAKVVQVLAAAVSAGLARMEQEAEAGRLRVQFERVFSPELVRELQRNPKMLEPVERTLTVLFSDIRGFSRMSEKIGAGPMFGLVGEVMDMLTEHVLEENGVIIDYHGDGMAAMWNAPLPYVDHADRACRAALQIQASLEELSQLWMPRLGEPLRIGLGIHTGSALVGNAGSKRRQKYGPIGHTMNLGSRIEGATKHAGVTILLSDVTKMAATTKIETRRVGPFQVVGMDEPVVLHELGSRADPAWASLKPNYEIAVDLFEHRRFDEANAVLEDLPDSDGPTALLRKNVARASSAAHEPSVFILDSK